MLFERIESKGLAHYSYLIGDKNEAVVIDPRRDCDIYIRKDKRNCPQIKVYPNLGRREALSELSQKKCVPCEGGIPPLTKQKAQEYMEEVPQWELVEDGTYQIKRKFEFNGFKEAMDFVNQVAEVAQNEGHHPNIHIYYNQVTLELYTHAIDGLHENDFIMAAKIDQIRK